MVGQGHAYRACRICYKRKTKCDRRLPECVVCTQNNRKCTYDPPRVPALSVEISRNANELPLECAHEDIVVDPQLHEQKLASAVYFLDPRIFEDTQMSLPTPGPGQHVPTYVKSILGTNSSIREIAAHYFEVVCPWLPVVSKQKLLRGLLNPLLTPRIDVCFLCLCMKLHTTPLKDAQDALTTEYTAVIRFQNELQLNTCCTLELLQGYVLLVIYEFGHAIYPSAFTRIGLCVQLAKILGLGFEDADYDAAARYAWPDEEERRRTWWAIYLIERVLCLQRPRMNMLIPTPPISARLPINDTKWRQNVRDNEITTLASPSSSVGVFASVLHTVYLLDCVLQHVKDHSLDAQIRSSNEDQLDRTLRAQIRYAESFTSTKSLISCNQTALSFSAMMILYSSQYWSSISMEDMRANCARAAMCDAAFTAARAVENFNAKGLADETFGDYAPFPMYWLYHSGTVLQHEGKLDELSHIKYSLEQSERRWRAAGIYLKLLEVQ